MVFSWIWFGKQPNDIGSELDYIRSWRSIVCWNRWNILLASIVFYQSKALLQPYEQMIENRSKLPTLRNI